MLVFATSFASRRRSRGSVEERPLHTRKVAGSIPAGTTWSDYRVQLVKNVFLRHADPLGAW